MKLKLLSACLLSAGVFAAARAQDDQPAASAPAPAAADQAAPGATAATPPAPAAAAPKFSEQQLVEEFGWFMAKRVGLPELDFNPEEVAALIKGVEAAASGKDSPYELNQIGPEMDGFIQRKQSVYLGKLKQKGLAESANFLTEIKKKPGVVVLPDGLCYEVIAPGEGAPPKPQDTVKVNYTGTLVNGTVFDSSSQHGGQPAEFQLDQVIGGWTEGLQKISKGGHIKLYVPPDLAYGDDGRPGIPPASTLIFDVELLDIKSAGSAAAKPEPAPAPAPEK
ncbi:MAG TPA: FKBP-type peptidyl-prolyl cis-trans isomerase [Opitutus sp.]|nr:FKBP-type peptidyl-prolyl cis-trans isomerase [Opitutus sp.]